MNSSEYTLANATHPNLAEQLVVTRPDGTVLLAVCEQSPVHNATIAALVAELNRLWNAPPLV